MADSAAGGDRTRSGATASALPAVRPEGEAGGQRVDGGLHRVALGDPLVLVRHGPSTEAAGRAAEPAAASGQVRPPSISASGP